MQTQTNCLKVTALVGSLALLGIASVFARPAAANCVDYKAAKSVSWKTPAADLRSYGLIKVSSSGNGWTWAPAIQVAPIVGLWSFKYISAGNATTLGIPDGTILDGGNTVWYADGNENTVSGVRDPGTGDVCLGTWIRTGEFTYELNHIGLSWDPVKSAPGGPAFIKQWVVVAADGNSYAGSVNIRQLDPDGKTLSTPAPILGNIYATRVTVNTTTQQSLP